MSVGFRLLTAFLVAILMVEPATLFLLPAAPAVAAPLPGQPPEPVIMYATMKTKVNIRLLDNKEVPVGPAPGGGWSNTPARMAVTVDEAPGANQFTGYRFLFKKGYQLKGYDGPIETDRRVGWKSKLGTELATLDIRYVNLPPSAFQPRQPTYSAVGPSLTSLPGGASPREAGGDGAIQLNPYVNVPEWGNAPTFDMPEFLMPSFTKPDFAMPSFDAPEWQNPKFTMPTFAMPQFQMPQFNMPSFTMPTFSMPGGGGSAGASAGPSATPASDIPVLDLRPQKDFIRNLEGAEAYNVPVRVYFGGTVFSAWPMTDSVTIVGCVKPPENAKLELADLEIYFNTVPPGQSIGGGLPPTRTDDRGVFELRLNPDVSNSDARTLRVGGAGFQFNGLSWRQDAKQPESEYTLLVNPNPPRLRLWAKPDRTPRGLSGQTIHVGAIIISPKGAPKPSGEVRFTTSMGSFQGGTFEGAGRYGGREYAAPLNGIVNPASALTIMNFTEPGTAIITAEHQGAKASLTINIEGRPQAEFPPMWADWPPRESSPRYSTYVDPNCPGKSVQLSAPGGGTGTGTPPLPTPASPLSATVEPTSYTGHLDWPVGSLTIEAVLTNKYGQKGVMWGQRLSMIAVNRDALGAPSDGQRLLTITASDLLSGTQSKTVLQIERQPNAVRLLIDGRQVPVPPPLAEFMLNLRPGRATFWFEVETPKEVIRSGVIRVTVGGGGPSPVPTPVSSPSAAISVSSPQKSLYLPGGAIELVVVYANSSPTTPLRNVSLSITGDGQPIFTWPLGELAPGAKGTTTLRLEKAEKGIRLSVNNKDVALPSFGSGLSLFIANGALARKVTIRAHLLASGVDTSSKPLEVEILNWGEAGSWFERHGPAIKRLNKWWDEAKALEPEGVKLLAELMAVFDANLDLVDKYGGLLEKADRRLQALEARENELKREVKERASVLVSEQVRHITKDVIGRFTAVVQKYGLEKYDIEDEKGEAEFVRFFQGLDRKQKTEIVGAIEWFSRLAQETIERFLRENPDLNKRINALVNETLKVQAEVLDILKPVNWAKLEQAELRWEALAPRFEKYAKAWMALASEEERLMFGLEELHTLIVLMGPQMREAFATFPEGYLMAQSFESAAEVYWAFKLVLSGLIEQMDAMAKHLDEPDSEQATGKEFKAADIKAEILKSKEKMTQKQLDISQPVAKFNKWYKELPPHLTTAAWSSGLRQPLSVKTDLKLKEMLIAGGIDRGPYAGGPYTGPNAPAKFRSQFRAPLRLAERVKAQARTAESLAQGASKLNVFPIIELMKQSGMPKLIVSMPMLAITLASPATLLVTDDRGRRAGYDPVGKKAVLEIPGATYSGPESSPQLVLIPLPLGQYKVEVNGTGSGEYHLGIARISGEKSEEQVVVDSIMPNQKHSYSVAASLSEALAVKTPRDSSEAASGAIAESKAAPAVGGGGVTPEIEAVKGAKTNWVLWAGIAAGVILILSGAGLLLLRRAESRKTG